MKHEIPTNRSKLTILLDPQEQEELKQSLADGETPDLAEVLEPLTCNSELDWIDPSETGDLTDAPMLGTRDNDEDGQTGPTGHGIVMERWAFMNYQVQDPVEVLAETGRLVFVS